MTEELHENPEFPVELRVTADQTFERSVITAEADPLRDEGEEYARRLRADGVEATYSMYSGMHHGFINLVHIRADHNYRRG